VTYLPFMHPAGGDITFCAGKPSTNYLAH